MVLWHVFVPLTLGKFINNGSENFHVSSTWNLFCSNSLGSATEKLRLSLSLPWFVEMAQGVQYQDQVG